MLFWVDSSVSGSSAYPWATDPEQVGTYSVLRKSGAGYFYDDVLEYRVCFYPEGGGDDRCAAFAEYEQALAFSKARPRAEEPLVLVRQREWINEPQPSRFIPENGEPITQMAGALAGKKQAQYGKHFGVHDASQTGQELS
jgi:hypothetical protein